MNVKAIVAYSAIVLWPTVFVLMAVIPWRLGKVERALGKNNKALDDPYSRFLRASLYSGALVSHWYRKRVMPDVDLTQMSRGDRILFRVFFWWIVVALIHSAIAYKVFVVGG